MDLEIHIAVPGVIQIPSVGKGRFVATATKLNPEICNRLERIKKTDLFKVVKRGRTLETLLLKGYDPTLNKIIAKRSLSNY